KWEKLLKNDSDEARSLREDAKSFYPARIRAGRAAYAFEELAKTKLPSSRGEGEAACTRLRGILGEFRALPLVQRKMGDLKRYARAAVEASLKDVEPATLLHAKWTALDAGRVRLEWDFDSPAEEQDFVHQLGYIN